MGAGIGATGLRRLALCALGTLWLAGHWFFPQGHAHLELFWWWVMPAAVLNADALPRLRGGGRWWPLLLALLLWQVVATTRATGAGYRAGGLADALGVIVLVVALVVLAGWPCGWPALRACLFVVAAATMGASLVAFYPVSGRALSDARLRDVLVYERGLNAVLTGLLAGFGMLCGMTLDRRGGPRVRRLAVWAGVALLAFALLASESRGALLAAVAGTAVLGWRRGRLVLPGAAAAVAGVLACLVLFSWSGTGEASPDLVSRGTTGRPDIWSVYLQRMDGADWWLGKGAVEPLDASVLGWFVDHPHSSFVTQLVHFGLPGLLLLGWFLGCAVRAGWRSRGDRGAALALLVFGLTGVALDCAQIASLLSVPRIEQLLVLVPAVFALNPAGAEPAG